MACTVCPEPSYMGKKGLRFSQERASTPSASAKRQRGRNLIGTAMRMDQLCCRFLKFHFAIAAFRTAIRLEKLVWTEKSFKNKRLVKIHGASRPYSMLCGCLSMSVHSKSTSRAAGIMLSIINIKQA
jgi:hypothetical protein